MVSETRYFTSDSMYVDSTPYRKLMVAQGASWNLASLETNLDYIGIGVFRLLSDLSEVEITDGDAHAVIRAEDGESPVEGNATWACPETALLPTDRILIKQYWCRSNGAGRVLGASSPHVTEVLNALHLDSATWTVYYWTAVVTPKWRTWYYGVGYPSRILNFSWTPVQAKKIYGDGLVWTLY